MPFNSLVLISILILLFLVISRVLKYFCGFNDTRPTLRIDLCLTPLRQIPRIHLPSQIWITLYTTQQVPLNKPFIRGRS